MRVLVAGATGAIGRPLVAALTACGHAVAGLTVDASAADLLSELGAQPLSVDVLDRDATFTAVVDARPEVVVEQFTALPRSYTPDLMRAALAPTGAVRTVGGDNVHAAAVAAGALSSMTTADPGPLTRTSLSLSSMRSNTRDTSIAALWSATEETR